MAEETPSDGLTDAAVLLMSMGATAAAEVIKLLTPKEAQRLGERMSQLKTASRRHIGEVLDRFEERMAETNFIVEDTDEYVRDVLKKALGEEKAGLLIDRILAGNDISGIENLKWMDAQAVAELIRNEHPQIIASILVHLERDHASGILLNFSDRLRGDVLLRISTLEGIQPTALRELNDVLGTLMSSGGSGKSNHKLGGPKPAAEILNYMGAAAEKGVLDWIQEQDADMAQRISDQMFVFADLINLDDKAIQMVLREAQTESLILALKGADQDLREKIFRNMSQRAAATLREDLESRGPAKVADVEAEQKEILKTVKRLADEGQIALGSGGGDDAYV